MKKILCISILTTLQLLAYEAGINADGSGGNATAIGDNSVATGLDSTAIGEYSIATGNNSIAIGMNSNAAGNNSTAIGSYTNVENSTTNSVAIGTGSVVYATNYNTGLPMANQDNVVSFGRTAENGSIGQEVTRRLINISDPINAHDAVNLNYLENNYYNKTYIDSLNTNVTNVLNSANNYADTQDRAVLNESKSYTDNKINSLEQTLTKDIKTATATSIALGVSPILADGNKNAIGLGFGNYEGQSAAAINYIAEINKNTHVQLGSSLNATSKGFKAGVSYGF